jgi:Phosphotransferase enzyme family
MSQAIFLHRVAGGTRVSRGGLSMTRDASFKKVVRRHAEQTGQRYTEALTDIEGLGARMDHEPVAERLLAHLRDRYGIDPVATLILSVHKTYVFRVDRNDGSPWAARAFPPARPRAGVEGDAAILRFLERQDYPAERLAADDAVSDFGGSAVLVTRFVEGARLPDGAAKFAMMGELLGRLHALPYDDSAGRAVRARRVRTCWRPCRFSTLSTRRSRPPAAPDSSSSATRCALPTMVTAFRTACSTETSSRPPITPS